MLFRSADTSMEHTESQPPGSPADVTIKLDDSGGEQQAPDSTSNIVNSEQPETSPNTELLQDTSGDKLTSPIEVKLDSHILVSSNYPPPASAATLSETFKTRVDPKDAWTVAYINSQYMHEVIDAIDKDNSGYITQREANAFVSTKPSGLSLPEWIAYWAAGV